MCENLAGRGLFRLAWHTYAFCRKAFVGRRFLTPAPTHPWTLLIHSWDFTDMTKFLLQSVYAVITNASK